MAEEQERPNDLNAFEAALAALVPRSDRLDRDRLMFLAGQAAVGAGGARVGRPRWGWPAAFGLMTAIAAGLLLALLARPPRSDEQIAERGGEAPASLPAAALAGDDLSAPQQLAEPSSGWMPAGWAWFAEDPSSLSPSASMRLRELASAREPDSGSAPGVTAATEERPAAQSPPRTQRELLDELIARPEARRPEHSGLFHEFISHLGAKS
jgi:hypothetical protein